MLKYVMIKLSVLSLLLVLVFSRTATAGVPVVSQMEVTDVTPASFAVTWVTSEPATCAVSVFASDCTTPITGLPMTAEGNDTTGVMRVTVSGLVADASYCYQTSTTSKSLSDVTVSPAQPATVVMAKMVLRTMATGTVLVPFGNDLLRVPTVSGAPDGVLGVLYVTGGKGPVSLLLTSDVNKHYFNMNNLFDAATGMSINLVGGEKVRIVERHGISGCSIDRFRAVPADFETTQTRDFVASPKPQDIDFNGTVNILDVLRVAGGMGTVGGDPCFNSELDVTSHNRVDQNDLNSVIGGFDETP